MDKNQLINLRSNARRLEADAGPKAAEAAALLPLIEQELAKRAPPPATPKPRVSKAKKKVAPVVDEEDAEEPSVQEL
jgi:hypothetical protein